MDIGKIVVAIAVVVFCIYLLYIVYHLLRPSRKSNYDSEVDAILASDKHKVKGRFE